MSTTDGAPTSYAAAVTELEQLLDALEDDELDIDRLSEQVRHAAELIRYCRQRIDEARVDVERIVAELDGDEATDPEPES